MTDTAPTLSPDEVQRFADIAARLTTNVSSVILGKPEVVKLALTGLFAEGHLLLEDVPGVGKTTLARAIAASVRGEWRREWCVAGQWCSCAIPEVTVLALRHRAAARRGPLAA